MSYWIYKEGFKGRYNSVQSEKVWISSQRKGKASHMIIRQEAIKENYMKILELNGIRDKAQ